MIMKCYNTNRVPKRRGAVLQRRYQGVLTGMPHFNINIWDWITGLDVDDLVINHSVDAFLVFDEIPANILATNVVRTLGNVRCKDTARVAAEEGCLVCVDRVSKRCLVVISGKNTVQCSLALETALCPGRLSPLSATSNISCLDTASLQLGSAVAQVTGFGCSLELASFLQLLGHRVARVSGGRA